MIHPIVKYGDPVLETPGKRVEKFDEDIEKLVADMFESMYAAAGVGLAAPQIGVGLRLTVIDVSNGKFPKRRWCWRIRKLFTRRASSARKKAAFRCRDFADMSSGRSM